MGNDTFFISDDYVDPNNLAYMAAVCPNVVLELINMLENNSCVIEKQIDF